MWNKRKCVSSSIRHTRFSGRKLCEDVESHGASRATADMSSPPSFTKVLASDYQLHTSIRNCYLVLPKRFCDEQRVACHVTMTDSTGHTLWPMLRNKNVKVTPRRFYVISNGWREFAYDHSLKLDDELVLTLVSPSHFVVQFATRVMLPTRDGTHYPWKRPIKYIVRWQNYSENVQVVAAKAATVLRKPSKQKDPEGTSSTRHSRLVRRKSSEALKSASASSGSPDTSAKAPSFTKLSTSKDSTKRRLHLPELTYMECKNPDGTTYLQMSDSDGEVTNEDS